MSSSIYEIDGNPIVDEKTRSKITDIKNVAKSGSYKDLDLTGATINTNYTLPNSSNSVLGGIKIGEGLSITNHGVLSAPIIDESLHKTNIQLTKDRKQIININDGDTIILPAIDNEELLSIDVEIHIPWNIEHKSPSVTFPTDIKWVESPRLKFDSWYNYRFMYVKDQWLGGFTEFDVVYDSSMNMFVFDTSKTAEDKTVTLSTNKRGDTTSYDGVTDWGDGNINSNTSHTYTNDGIYMVKTKYDMDNSNNRDNNTRKKLVDCININKNMTDLSGMFSNCINVVEFSNSSNWDTSNIKNMSNMFYNCNNLTTLDVSNFDTSKVTDMGWMFYSCKSLTTLDVSNFDMHNVTTIDSMFSDCNSIESLDMTNWNTANVTNIGHALWERSGLFNKCRKLTEIKGIENLNISKVSNLGATFRGCNNLKELNIGGWDTSMVETTSQMFNGCSSLLSLDLNNWNTNKFKDITAMFYGCSNLIKLNINNWNTSNITKLSNAGAGVIGTFLNCKSLKELDLSNWTIEKATECISMFDGCTNLTTLNISNFDTSNITNMNSMFNSCPNLTALDVSNFDTTKVNNMYGMFYKCNNLTTLDVSNFDTTNVTNMDRMFSYCNNLTTLDLSNFDTTNVTNMVSMFGWCGKLSTLDISNFNIDNVTNMDRMFEHCTSLHQSGLTMTNCNETTKTKINSMVQA